MTDDELRRARELAEAATPGPWTSHPHRASVEDSSYVYRATGSQGLIGRFSHLGQQGADNAAFIAAARQLVPALVDEAERLKFAAEHYRASRDAHSDYADSARAEVEAMRAVVEAAEEWRGHICYSEVDEDSIDQPLMIAIDAYRTTTKGGGQ